MFFLQSLASQRLFEILFYYVQNAIEMGEVKEYNPSPLYVREDDIVVNYETEIDIKKTLETLTEYEEKASHREAFRGMLAWADFPQRSEIWARKREGFPIAQECYYAVRHEPHAQADTGIEWSADKDRGR